MFHLVEHQVEGLQGTYKTILIPKLEAPSLHGGQLMNNLQIDSLLGKGLSLKNTFGKVWDKKINIATYGYATSVHKAQGNEWDNVYIDASWLSDNWNKSRWMYTAITRAKSKVEIKMSNQIKLVE